VTFEDTTIDAKLGEPLMVALLANDVAVAARSVKYHRARGPFCLAGTCGQCWMRIDGVPNRPACLEPVRPGLRVERQNAFPSADLDVFGATDLLFPGGLDHHRLGTTPVGPLNELVANTARQMAGFGPPADEPPAPLAPTPTVAVDALVVGGGPAGLGAAKALAERGLGVLLAERRDVLGGRLATGLYPEPAWRALVDDTHQVIEANGGRVLTGALVLGSYPPEGGETDAAAPRAEATAGAPEVVAEVLVRVGHGDAAHLLRVAPDAIVLAPGGYPLAGTYGGSDLPGHFGLRALATLALVHGVLPGDAVAIVEPAGAGDEPRRLAAALAASGAQVTRVRADAHEAPGADDGAVTVLAGYEPTRTLTPTLGTARVKGLELRGPDGRTRTVSAALVADGRPPAPAFELAAQLGARVEHQPTLGGFIPRTDAALGLGRPGVFGAGELLGAKSAEAALAQGARAGEAAAAWLLGPGDPR
jgi:sarcosine oxidase subunit alpha